MTTASNSLKTTGIGSLPHHNLDAALEFSFKMGIPFLPQIPIRNAWEYMIPQALEGLPGLQVESDGGAVLNVGIWNSRTHAFKEKLSQAFAPGGSLEAFEPITASSSGWQAFIWECEERHVSQAKVQIAGPITSQWVLEASQLDKQHQPELSAQVFQLITARALAMGQRLLSSNIQPIVFLDEPGLFALNLENPRHVLALQELKILIQTLRHSKIQVGLHCCSNAAWKEIVSLPLDYLSIDFELSFENLVTTVGASAIAAFLERDGKFSLGVIPTSFNSQLGLHYPLDLVQLVKNFSEKLKATLPPPLVSQILKTSIFTPACGLALHSVSDAEWILGALNEFANAVG